jgi:AraC-like DNA-binding protein/mannose-6-phosphate isomerase-like protein (cupin superfamily)
MRARQRETAPFLLTWQPELIKMDDCKISFRSVYNETSGLRFDLAIGNFVERNFPMHIHDSLCIGLVRSGERRIILTDKEIVVTQGEIFVIAPNQPHSVVCSRPHDYVAVTVKRVPRDDIFENVINTDQCRQLFAELTNAIEENSPKLDGKWYNLYSHLINTHLSPKPSPVSKDFVRRSLEFISRNYDKPVSVGDIAAHAHMSTFHFSRLFRQHVGMSPHSFLVQYRLSRSREELRGNAQVFDAAIGAGFYDSSHFIKTFRSHMAASPQRYREQVSK